MISSGWQVTSRLLAIDPRWSFVAASQRDGHRSCTESAEPRLATTVSVRPVDDGDNHPWSVDLDTSVDVDVERYPVSVVNGHHFSSTRFDQCGYPWSRSAEPRGVAFGA